MIKKILPILSAFLLLGHLSFSQKSEFGLGIGGISYSGDLQRGYHVLDQKLGVQAIYRINTSKDVAWKFSALYGSVSGSDEDPFDILGEVRQASFQKTFLEVSAVFEYHFLDYKHEKSLIRWSPYVFAGGGVANFNTLEPIIPFGVGFKHLIGKQFTVAVEYGARKTFFDDLDNISDADLSQKQPYQFGNPGDQDWYHFLGISFSYILYRVECKYRYVPNKSIHYVK